MADCAVQTTATLAMTQAVASLPAGRPHLEIVVFIDGSVVAAFCRSNSISAVPAAVALEIVWEPGEVGALT